MHRRHAAQLVAVVAALIGVPQGARSQANFSGLRDQALNRVDDLGSGVADVIGGLLDGGSPVQGQVTRVVVSDDREHSATVKISYSGFAGAMLVAAALDSQRQAHHSVTQPRVKLDASRHDVLLVLELQKNTADGTAFVTPYLRLAFYAPGKALPSRTVTYAMAKRWQTAILPEDVTVQLTAQPLGDAATLDATMAARFAAPGSLGSTPPPPPPPPPGTGGHPGIFVPPPPPAGGGGHGVVAALPPRAFVARNVTGLVSPQAILIASNVALTNRTDFQPGLSRQQADSGMQGPSGQPIDLLQGVRTSGVNFTEHDLNELLGVRSTVYGDKNPASGVYYFVPGTYHVRWDPDQAYDLHIIYRSASDTGSGGAVQMSLDLSAGIGSSDLDVAAWLLQAYVKRNGPPPQRPLQLRRLPMDSFPSVSLSDDLKRLYDIPATKVRISQISDALGELSVDWVTDARTSADMQTELRAKGLTGAAILKSQGALPPQSVPIEIALRDPGTYGRIAWVRGGDWSNRTPYPIIAKRLHALLVAVDGTPTIFSWDLGSSIVPPKAHLAIDAATIASWLDQRALRMWMEYGVAEGCDSCDDAAMNQIRAGGGGAEQAAITFHTLTPLADLGAAVLTVKLRSRYFDPHAHSLTTAPGAVSLTADGKDFPGGSIFPPPTPADSAAAAAAGPLFEYQLGLVMPDGTAQDGVNWIPVAAAGTVFVGRAQVKQSLGSLPTTQPGSPK